MAFLPRRPPPNAVVVKIISVNVVRVTLQITTRGLMCLSIRLLAPALLGVAAFLPAAHAQDMTTATVAGTTIWVGGGVQFLSLPDIRFTEKGDHRQKNSESDWLDAGVRPEVALRQGWASGATTA